MNLANSARGAHDDAEAALAHEVVVLLAGDDLLDRRDELVARLGRHALRRRDAAPRGHRPVAAGRLPSASARSGYSAGRACRPSRRGCFTLPASISERASGSEQGTISHAAGDEVLQARRGAVRRHPRHASPDRPSGPAACRRCARCQMPPCPVPDALSLPGFALIGGDQVVDGLVRRVGARPARRPGSALTRPIGVYDAPVEVGQPLPVHHADLDRDHADRVAVGRRGRDRAVADDAAAAGAVDDVDRLAELLLEQRADDRAPCASVPPPAPHGTISVIGRSGYAASATDGPPARRARRARDG